MSPSVAKNTAFMTAASIGQKIISFVYFTFVARGVGVEGTGKYFFALSFTTIFSVFVDLGLTNILVRESAKDKEKLGAYLGNILFFKAFLGLVTYCLAVVSINLMDYSPETRSLVYLSGITMLFDSLHLTFYGALRALGNLKYEAYSLAASQGITLVLGSIFLWQNRPLIFLILAFAIPAFLNAFYAGGVLFFKYRVRPKFGSERGFAAKIWIMSWPFALAAIFARFYSYVDSVLLSKLAGDAAVGWYSIPYKITYAFQFIPTALTAALYPKFSECFAVEKSRLGDLFSQSFKYLLIVVLPISIGLSVLADKIIPAVFGNEYLPSVLALRLLLAGLIFSFLSFPVGALLNACGRQLTQTSIVGVVMVFNIALNLLLIPIFGIYGASFAAFLGNFLLLSGGLFFARRIANIDFGAILKNLIRIFASALSMGIICFFVGNAAGFVPAIAVGAAIYPLFLFVFGAVSRGEVKEFLFSLKKS